MVNKTTVHISDDLDLLFDKDSPPEGRVFTLRYDGFRDTLITASEIRKLNLFIDSLLFEDIYYDAESDNDT